MKVVGGRVEQNTVSLIITITGLEIDSQPVSSSPEQENTCCTVLSICYMSFCHNTFVLLHSKACGRVRYVPYSKFVFSNVIMI